MTRRTPKVGDVLYSLNVGNAARRVEQKLTPVTVTKVGRKYFETDGGNRRHPYRYHLSNWEQDAGGFMAFSCLYETEQEWLDEKEENSLREEFRKAFDWGVQKHRYSLDQLRRIKAIIEEGSAS